MKVLLTGGSGFIGRNLVAKLGEELEVLAPGRSELDLLDPLSVRAWLARTPVDAVVHAATIPGHRNAPPARDLAVGTVRMLLHLVRHAPSGTRFVVLGSGAEYDASRDVVRAREDDPAHPVPRDETGLSKLVLAA